MADLAKDDVTINRSWYAGQDKQIMSRDVNLTLSGQGTTANAINADTLGFKTFEGISTLTKGDDSEVVIGIPSVDKSQLLLKAAGTNAPAAFTGAYRGVVNGRAH